MDWRRNMVGMEPTIRTWLMNVIGLFFVFCLARLSDNFLLQTTGKRVSQYIANWPIIGTGGN